MFGCPCSCCQRGEVSESNCHPFHYKNLLMAHNGGIEEFGKVKRKLRDPLSDEMYNWIKGQTDSEHIFAYLVNYLNKHHKAATTDAVADAFENTFGYIKKLMADTGIKEAAYLNMTVTNGDFIVGTRWCSDPAEEPLTMYHSEGSRYVVEDGTTRLEAPKDDDMAVLVVSEKLSDGPEWTMLPKNHLVMVEPDLNVRVRPIHA